jgi:hypothetical protein
MAKTLIVGMNPSKDHDPPLLPTVMGRSGSSADRLLRMSGLTRDTFLKVFDRVNLLDSSKWNEHRAWVSGTKLMPSLLERDRVLVLGILTWLALDLPVKPGMFSEHKIEGTTFVQCPHPSGRNRVFNDKSVVKKFTEVLGRG